MPREEVGRHRQPFAGSRRRGSAILMYASACVVQAALADRISSSRLAAQPLAGPARRASSRRRGGVPVRRRSPTSLKGGRSTAPQRRPARRRAAHPPLRAAAAAASRRSSSGVGAASPTRPAGGAAARPWWNTRGRGPRRWFRASFATTRSSQGRNGDPVRKATECPVGLHERLLGGILRVGGRPTVTYAVRKAALLVLAHSTWYASWSPHFARATTLPRPGAPTPSRPRSRDAHPPASRVHCGCAHSATATTETRCMPRSSRSASSGSRPPNGPAERLHGLDALAQAKTKRTCVKGHAAPAVGGREAEGDRSPPARQREPAGVQGASGE